MSILAQIILVLPACCSGVLACALRVPAGFAPLCGLLLLHGESCDWLAHLQPALAGVHSGTLVGLCSPWRPRRRHEILPQSCSPQVCWPFAASRRC